MCRGPSGCDRLIAAMRKIAAARLAEGWVRELMRRSPVSWAQGQSAMGAVPDAGNLWGLAVLVVDDNTTKRRVLEEMLIGWQMVPTLVASAPEALAALRVAQEAGTPLPLVLSDVQMPGMDGFALAEAIKMDAAIADATVVMLTWAGQPGDAARCRELGIAGYLNKPIKRSELRATTLLASVGLRNGSEWHWLRGPHARRPPRPPCSRAARADASPLPG
jgi:CheY-like chemotaxis protein